MRKLVKSLLRRRRRRVVMAEDVTFPGLGPADLPVVPGEVCEVCGADRVGLVEVQRGPGVEVRTLGCMSCGCAWSVEAV